ncbi:cupredoxin domain-containing protein [Candidatus Kaiserbacteria bacterium]|nr:cupredoxin domain-containing protein [Candidatus Kaiserbacteria bacterium]
MNMKRVLVIACFMVAMGTMAAFALGTRAQEVIVVRTERGFKPSVIQIHKGDTVVFVSTGAEFWPASDVHPTHGIYSEFDPRTALQPHEQWKFRFDKAGVWSFHDHLEPQMRGKILVVGEDGESIRECLEARPGTIQPECWEAEVTTLIDTSGITEAFDAVKRWYSEMSEFQRNCHDVMHVIGTATYERYMQDESVTWRPEVSYCGWGFYHGFIERMFVRSGAGYFDEVLSYCAQLREVPEAAGAVGPCYHGIGHAVFDSLSSSLWGDDEAMVREAIGVCERILPRVWERVRCASGVYNALANAYSARDYYLSFRDEEPIPTCGTQRPEYRNICYMEVGNGYIRDKHWGKEESFNFISHIQDIAARASVLQGYMDTEVRRTIDSVEPPRFVQDCESFMHESDVQGCIDGVVVGIFNIAAPGKEWETASWFCDALHDASRQTHCRDVVDHGREL